MRYEGTVYRPPSEAYSLIIQVTIGCSHNKCTFCSMFKDKKFRIRSLEDIFEDLERAERYYKTVKKVFLADADALVLKTDHLEKILLKIKELFPECEKVSTYTTAKDILRKSESELLKLKNQGLKMVYLGIETGSDEILKEVKKGVTANEMIEAGKRVKKVGIKLSVTLISGLGGTQKSKEHAIESSKVINAIDPDYLGLLTLTVDNNTEMYDKVHRGEVTPLSPREVMIENRKLVENLQLTHCVLRSNHVCNYVPLAATLNEQKELLLEQLDQIIEEDYNYKNEIYRR